MRYTFISSPMEWQLQLVSSFITTLGNGQEVAKNIRKKYLSFSEKFISETYGPPTDSPPNTPDWYSTLSTTYNPWLPASTTTFNLGWGLPNNTNTISKWSFSAGGTSSILKFWMPENIFFQMTVEESIRWQEPINQPRLQTTLKTMTKMPIVFGNFMLHQMMSSQLDSIILM